MAYATPVDARSTDTWSLVDWNLHFATDPADIALIPVAGRVFGGNNTFFRSDVSITNAGADVSKGTVRYYPRDKAPIERAIELAPGQSEVVRDVVTTWFPAAGDSVGHIVLTPRTGQFTVSSRTFSTVGNDPASFGMGVPTLSLASTLRAGQSRLISGLEVSHPSSKPATFRTNFGLLETAGEAVTVRITVYFAQISGVVAASASQSWTETLAPHQFKLSSLIDEIANRRPVGDLRDVQVEFKVIQGNGAVGVFTSSVDNGSSDQLLRVE